MVTALPFWPIAILKMKHFRYREGNCVTVAAIKRAGNVPARRAKCPHYKLKITLPMWAPASK
jgi:hypothetical protein